MIFTYLISDKDGTAINLEHCSTIEVTKDTDLSSAIKISHSRSFTMFKTKELAVEDFESLMKAIKCQKYYWKSLE